MLQQGFKDPDAQHRSPGKAGDTVHRCALALGRLYPYALRRPDGQILLANVAQEQRDRWIHQSFDRAKPDDGGVVAAKARIPDGEKGLDVDFTKPIQGGPVDLGFDYAYFTAACSTIDGPFCYIENRHTVGIPNRKMPIDKSVPADYRPRPGWMAEGFDIRKVDVVFTRKAIEFIQRSCQQRPCKPFFLYLALSSPHAPWLPPDFIKGASKEGPRGDLVALVDWSVGQVLDALERLGIADKTLVIVTSDNGPRHGANGHKSAGELRGYKSHIWEGGHRVPFVARWPGRIEPGSTSDEVICLTDLMATCAGILGVDLPADAGPDSFNILPALLGKKLDKPIRPAIVHHSCFGVFSIRAGRWKLIRTPTNRMTCGRSGQISSSASGNSLSGTRNKVTAAR